MSIKEFDYQPANDNDIVVYPNPCLNQINVSFYSDQDKDCTVKVYNTIGKLMYSSLEIISNSGIQNFEIETKDFNSGIYFVNIELDQTILTKKISVVK